MSSIQNSEILIGNKRGENNDLPTITPPPIPTTILVGRIIYGTLYYEMRFGDKGDSDEITVLGDRVKLGDIITLVEFLIIPEEKYDSLKIIQSNESVCYPIGFMDDKYNKESTEWRVFSKCTDGSTLLHEICFYDFCIQRLRFMRSAVYNYINSWPSGRKMGDQVAKQILKFNILQRDLVSIANNDTQGCKLLMDYSKIAENLNYFMNCFEKGDKIQKMRELSEFFNSYELKT